MHACVTLNLWRFRVLLDQLLQYEPMSGEEETVTDYSGSEDEVAMDNRLQRPVPPAAAKQVSLSVCMPVKNN